MSDSCFDMFQFGVEMLVCGVGAGFCYLYAISVTYMQSHILSYLQCHVYLVRREDQSLQVEGRTDWLICDIT